ncbi:MAG: toxin-antitoxin system TumE family protein [Candidatus Loosdrechtia sp.]|uniref:toxin-antitoxin system TumE family protein n=1 Tax=Candidatus Loosdrechtia sp. TaxID=3101272 RepID=UPI003A7784DB|nr:MAG: DUF6516 family protein [Candidatus Jettenia sp. AMX2]
MKGRLIQHIKVREDTGNIVEIRLWQVNPSHDKPHGYKYSLVYIVKGKRVIGYDNAEGKGDHRHYRDKEEVYTFKSVDKLIEDFYNDIRKVKIHEG